MAIVVPNQGEILLLNWMLRTAFLGPEPIHIHLYTNFYDPLPTSVVSDFVEASFPGYDVVELDRADWSFPVNIAGVASITYAPGFVQWLASSGGPYGVWGYFVTTEDDASILWAERFTGEQIVTTVVPVLVLPTMRLHSESDDGP